MSTNEIFNQMLSSYDITTELQKRNAIFEVNQQIILSGLYNLNFRLICSDNASCKANYL